MIWRRKIKKMARRFSGYNTVPRNAKRRRLYYLGLASTFVFFGLLLFLFVSLVAFAIYSKDIPSPNKLTARDVALSTKIFDRNGELLYDIYGQQNRTLVELKDLPPHIKQATIAIEDKDFYKHQGFAPIGIVRSVFEIIVHRTLQGGSTITQQVVKNTLLSPERTLTRKLKEFILAIQIEKKYPKDEILQIYLNEVSYGGTAYGIEAAAQTYFSKHAKDLSLAEAALLAGLPVAPTRNSPFGTHPEYAKERQVEVLRRMREDSYISKEDEEKAKNEELKFSPKDSAGIKAPHFVMYIKELLAERYGEKMVEQGGLQVTTSLDLKIQEAAQKIVTEEIAKLKGLDVGNGAVVVLDPKTGEILAMVGSKDYFAKDYDGQVNVTVALRQPGSAIKPITYAAAFKKGYSPSYLIMDTPTVFPGGEGLPEYKPVNYDGKYRGPMQIRFTLGNSENIPAVKTLALVGLKDMLTLASDMGLENLKPTQENMARFGLALTLGGGEVRLLDLTSAFGVFATGGVKQDQTAILKVTDTKGKVLEEYKKTSGKRVLSSEISFLISHILSDNNARLEVFGPQSFLVVSGKTVAVKTGTTDDKKDNWTIGYTPSYVVGAWVGNNDNSSMNQRLASGVTGAAPIWNKVMREVLKGKPAEDFQKPDDVIAIEVDSLTGGMVIDGKAKRSEYFIRGTEPQSSPFYQKLKISKNDGSRLANEVEIAKGEYEEKDFVVFKENDPVSTDGRNRWQEGIDAWLSSAENIDGSWKPPGIVSQSKSEDVVVRITSPNDRSEVEYELDVVAEVTSASQIVKVDFEIDGTNLKSLTSNPYSYHVVFPGTARGKHKIKVRAQNSVGNVGENGITVSVGEPFKD